MDSRIKCIKSIGSTKVNPVLALTICCFHFTTSSIDIITKSCQTLLTTQTDHAKQTLIDFLFSDFYGFLNKRKN